MSGPDFVFLHQVSSGFQSALSMRSTSRSAVFLVVPGRARLLPTLPGWPRQCSRRVPARRAVPAFVQESAAFLTRCPRWYRLNITATFVSKRSKSQQ